MAQTRLDISYERRYPVKPSEKRDGGCDVCGGYVILYEPGTHPKFPDCGQETYICEWCNSTISEDGRIMDKRLTPDMVEKAARDLVRGHARGE